jgi:hypothetical protein
MGREVDFRAGETYSGPEDHKFLRDCLLASLGYPLSFPGSCEEARAVMSVAFGKKNAKPAELAAAAAAAAAAEWESCAQGATLHADKLSAIAFVLGCTAATSLGVEPDCPADADSVRAAITEVLAKEWKKVLEATEKLRKRPSVLDLTAAGDICVLSEHMERLRGPPGPLFFLKS